MPSSYTARGRLEKQFTGENVNLWGDKLDATLDRIDDFVAGYVALTITGDYTLQVANSNTSADEARNAHLKLNGSPSVNFTITVPNVSKSYKFWNNTAKVATISAGAGATVSIDAGDKLDCWCDGTNVNHGVYFGGLGLKDFIAASVLTATGSLPSVTGQAGKYIYTDGVSAFWRQPSTTDLSDYADQILGVQVALAFAASRRR